MTDPVLLGVALAGGLGAALRFLVDGAVTARLGPRRPWGTFVVNVTGSFLLGVLTGLAGAWAPGWVAVAGTGLLGGYTTFSTATWEAVRLLHGHHWTPALVHTAGLLLACLAAAWVGLALAG